MSLTFDSAPTVLHGRPGYEGANIRTWIGFKHFMYLAEHAVLSWLQDQGHGARMLFHEHGLGVEIVDCSVQLPAVLELDDQVSARVTAARDGRLTVRLSVLRDGHEVTVLRGKVTVALVRERTAPRHRPAPGPLARLEVGGLSGPRVPVPPVPPAAYRWSWRAPYYYCHFSDRVQHSGFVRTLEEAVDRFLADRDISIGRLLTERHWIPVVSRARVRLLGSAHMEETVHTVFSVTGILRRTLFEASMDCYVPRDGAYEHVANARILHGYAIAAGPDAGSPATLDETVIKALTDGAA
jgi:acyl-CoA thioesterase FadM